MRDNGDILLYALSARHRVPWRRFRQYFDEVYRRAAISRQDEEDQGISNHRWHVLRALSSLGHIDWQFGTGGIEVVAAFPALALLPVLRSCSAVLCGARSPGTVDRLRQASSTFGVAVSVLSQAGISPYAPARVELQAENALDLKAVADKVGIQFMNPAPARLLARGSVSLSEYKSSLIWSSDSDLDWPRRDFNAEQTRFSEATDPSTRHRLSQYRNPVTSVPRHRLWQDGMWAEVEPDWGRFTILAASTNQGLQYLLEKRKVLVPFGAPLPVLLSRALGLCSGTWPRLIKTSSSGLYYEFSGVPPSILNTVASKLEIQVSNIRG